MAATPYSQKEALLSFLPEICDVFLSLRELSLRYASYLVSLS
jgi:hypothetical protein